MGKLEFRLLRADEIDARIGSANDKGITLLLYKDARCDQNILDETVGPMNWQRHHSRENANCTVSIWDDDKGQWVEKEDTGTESNTESEKGLASDSFKRACFNWGIGRELYTAPFMWIDASKLKEHKNVGGKWKCSDRFTVTKLTYSGRTISGVTVKNKSGDSFVFFAQGEERKTEQTAPEVVEQDTEAIIAEQPIDLIKARALAARCAAAGVDEYKLCELYNVKSFVELTERKHSNIINFWNQVVEKCKKTN